MTIEQNKYSCSTILWRHLKKEHRKEYNELRAQEVRSPSQPSVANYFERKVNTKQYYTGRTTEDTKEELVHFIFQSASPWNIVSKKILHTIASIHRTGGDIPSINKGREGKSS